MAYDWTGVQTRRTRRLRFLAFSLAALAAVLFTYIQLQL